MAIDILYNIPINIGSVDFSLDIVIADTRDMYDFSIILGRSFFAQASLIFYGEQGRTIIRTPEEYQIFDVTYPMYKEDLSQTPELLLLKGVVDAYTRKGVEEEEARGYLHNEDSHFEDEEEDKEPEGQGLPRTS